MIPRKSAVSRHSSCWRRSAPFPLTYAHVCHVTTHSIWQQMILIEIRNRQLAKQREHEAAWSLEQEKQNLAIDHRDKREKELRLRSLQQQNKQEWLQQMKDKQTRALSEKQDVQFGNLFGN